jgi:hypothetical protein
VRTPAVGCLLAASIVIALPQEAAAGWFDEPLIALREWSVAEYLRRSFYAYPIVNLLHIFGFILLIGGILPVDLRLLGAFPSVPVAFFGRILEPMALIGLVLAVTAGVLLFVVKPLEYGVNPSFLTKVTLVALGTLNALALRLSAGWRLAMEGGAVLPRVRVQAIASVVIWLSALAAGRFIAFLE